MAVTPYYGDQGWTKIDGVNVFCTTTTPEDDPALYVPQLPGGFFPLNYTEGVVAPTAVVRTSPYSTFWNATYFGSWFGVGTTVRTGDITSTALVNYNDGYTGTGLLGAKGDSFTIEIVQGAPVLLTMGFMGIDIGTAGAAPTRAALAPAMGQLCTFAAGTGVHRAVISYSNQCAPSGEISGGSRPAAITAFAPVFTYTVLQKAAGAAPSTTETVTIPCTNNGTTTTATIVMKFRQSTGPRRVVANGETLYERTYTGMHLAAGDVPFTMTWS